MGLYDSFIIQHEGIEREIQTKKLLGVMDRYRVGDVVFGADPGVQVVHDFFFLDRDGEMTWDENKKEREIHVFFIIRFGVFMAYQMEEGELERQELEARASALQLDALNDTARFELICIESLKRKTKHLRQLSNTIHAVAGVIQASKMSDDEVQSAWFVTAQQKRAQAGRLAEVIEEILSGLDEGGIEETGF